jgi:hypothetical protein
MKTVVTCKYRNALMWAYDRITVDNPTKKEMSATLIEIGKVLSEQPSVATDYAPNKWDQSATQAPPVK